MSLSPWAVWSIAWKRAHADKRRRVLRCLSQSGTSGIDRASTEVFLQDRNSWMSQLSVAVAVPVLAGNVLPVHSIVTFAGQVIIGAALSSTNIV